MVEAFISDKTLQREFSFLLSWKDSWKALTEANTCLVYRMTFLEHKYLYSGILIKGYTDELDNWETNDQWRRIVFNLLCKNYSNQDGHKAPKPHLLFSQIKNSLLIAQRLVLEGSEEGKVITKTLKANSCIKLCLIFKVFIK